MLREFGGRTGICVSVLGRENLMGGQGYVSVLGRENLVGQQGYVSVLDR